MCDATTHKRILIFPSTTHRIRNDLAVDVGEVVPPESDCNLSLSVLYLGREYVAVRNGGSPDGHALLPTDPRAVTNLMGK
jgi:hypothetical protein